MHLAGEKDRRIDLDGTEFFSSWSFHTYYCNFWPPGGRWFQNGKYRIEFRYLLSMATLRTVAFAERRISVVPLTF